MASGSEVFTARQLGKLLENVHDVILLIRDGVVDRRLITRPALGYPPDAERNYQLGDQVHPDDKARVLAAYLDMLSAGPGSIMRDEVRLARWEEGYSWVELTATNLMDDPDIGAVVMVMRNIDDRKAIVDELVARREQAQRMLHDRIRLVAQVGHELRNPVHGLLAASDLLATHDLPPDSAELVRVVRQLSGTLRTMLDDLLDAAQLDLGALRFRSEIVDVAEIITSAVDHARPTAQDGVQVTTRPVPEGSRWTIGDPARLRQALVNILHNACKHTATGSIEVVAAQGQAPDTIRISVLDTGSGIRADEADILFDPFERGDQRNPTVGVGLGLAIVRGIAAQMGGVAGAAPRPEGGSEFWIEVPSVDPPDDRRSPAAVGAADEPPVAAASMASSPTGRRVLVVDDSPVNVTAASMMIEHLGSEALTCTDPLEALDLVRNEHVDVIIVDGQMPGMDGFEFIRRLRALDIEQPVVALMTGMATPESEVRALEVGADVFVAKPAGLDVFEHLLSTRRHPA